MMFKSWAIGLCLSSLAGTVIYFISPQGNLQKTLKTVLSIFFITVMASPLVQIAKLTPSEIVSGYTYNDEKSLDEDAVNSVIFDNSINEIEKAIEIFLRNNGVSVSQINVSASIGNNNSIIINSIEIECNTENKEKLSVFQDEIENEFNAEIRIILTEEKYD